MGQIFHLNDHISDSVTQLQLKLHFPKTLIITL